MCIFLHYLLSFSSSKSNNPHSQPLSLYSPYLKPEQNRFKRQSEYWTISHRAQRTNHQPTFWRAQIRSFRPWYRLNRRCSPFHVLRWYFDLVYGSIDVKACRQRERGDYWLSKKRELAKLFLTSKYAFLVFSVALGHGLPVRLFAVWHKCLRLWSIWFHPSSTRRYLNPDSL